MGKESTVKSTAGRAVNRTGNKAKKSNDKLAAETLTVPADMVEAGSLAIDTRPDFKELPADETTKDVVRRKAMNQVDFYRLEDYKSLLNVRAHANIELFAGKLPDSCHIRVMDNVNGRMFYLPGKVSNGTETESAYGVNTDNLRSMSAEEVIVELVHVMVHEYCFTHHEGKGKPNSRNHDKRFLELAKSIGLDNQVAPDSSYKISVQRAIDGSPLAELVAELAPSFSLTWESAPREKKVTVKNSRMKFVCKCQGENAKAFMGGKNLINHVICDECGEYFAPEDIMEDTNALG